jgi:hypothetical protein
VDVQGHPSLVIGSSHSLAVFNLIHSTLTWNIEGSFTKFAASSYLSKIAAVKQSTESGGVSIELFDMKTGDIIERTDVACGIDSILFLDVSKGIQQYLFQILLF